MAQKRVKAAKSLPFSVFAQPFQKGKARSDTRSSMQLYGEFSLNVSSYFCQIPWLVTKKVEDLRHFMIVAVTNLWYAELQSATAVIQLVTRSNGPFSIRGLGKNGMDDAIVGIECEMRAIPGADSHRRFAVLPRCHPLKNTAFWTFPGLIERTGAVLFVGHHVSFVEVKHLDAEALVAIDQALERGQA